MNLASQLLARNLFVPRTAIEKFKQDVRAVQALSHYQRRENTCPTSHEKVELNGPVRTVLTPFLSWRSTCMYLVQDDPNANTIPPFMVARRTRLGRGEFDG